MAGLLEYTKNGQVTEPPLYRFMRGNVQSFLNSIPDPSGLTREEQLNLGLNVNPMLALSTASGNIAKGLLSKTQFEKAQEVASKNAETLLGLPKGNTAMDRAKALSFEFGYGHGSPNPNITELLPSRMGAEGTGVYATNYLPETAQYAGKEIGATSYPLAVRTDRALNVGTANPFEYLNVSGTENLSKNLNKLGKDAIIRTHEETPEWLINAGADMLPSRQHYVSNLPANFRSPFAAFDPARVNEPDLLAALMAIPVSGLLEQPKDKKKKK